MDSEAERPNTRKSDISLSLRDDSTDNILNALQCRYDASGCGSTEKKLGETTTKRKFKMICFNKIALPSADGIVGGE